MVRSATDHLTCISPQQPALKGVPMFRYYLKLSMLSIRANPALSALMVAAIAIGIGACMSIVTVRHVMSDNPLAHKNDVLYHVRLDNWNPDDPYDEPNEPPEQVTYLDSTRQPCIRRDEPSGKPSASSPVASFSLKAKTRSRFRKK